MFVVVVVKMKDRVGRFVKRGCCKMNYSKPLEWQRKMRGTHN
jgi:hypothetical protein